MGKLAGKTASITGGAQGIGAASVKHFVDQGAKVVIADIETERGEALAKELDGSAVFQRCDVTDEADTEALIQRACSEFGGLDIMWNNAGAFGVRGSILETSVEGFDKTLALLVRSVFLGTKHAGIHMKEKGSGAILNTCSISANTPGYGPHIYQAAKAAVEQFTKTVALELAEYGTRINCVSPGGVPTQLITSALGAPEEAADGIAQAMGSTLPLGHVCSGLDIAMAAAFLCSDEAAYITAQNLIVDGAESTGKKWSTQPLH